MSEQEMMQQAPHGLSPGETMRNPYIIKFCRVLVEKKGEEHEPEVMEKLLDDMYKVYEFLLGKNMIQALPEEVRARYLEIANDLQNLSYEKIGDIFDRNIPDYEKIMKETMKQFAEIFMKNREFKAQEHLPEQAS